MLLSRFPSLFLSQNRHRFPTPLPLVYASTDLGSKPELELPRPSGTMRQATGVAAGDKSSKSARTTVDGKTPSRIMNHEIRAATNR